jgi:hypothetical protein
MAWVICFFIGLIAGAASVFVFMMDRHAKMRSREAAAQTLAAQTLKHRDEIAEKERALSVREREFTDQRSSFDQRVISYDEIKGENGVLKRDLQNIDVELNKLRLDDELKGKNQQLLDERATELSRRFLKDTLKSIASSLNPNNYSACKDRLTDAIQRVRDIGFPITLQEEGNYLADLKANFERVVRAAIEREEQARIKAQIREEEKLRREVERELAQAERERLAIQAALDQATALARDQYSAEVEQLKAKLAEAEERGQRAISMAQQTKAGNVYVISNVGTFGQGVYKIGMTRRLEPLDRVRELGDASVPFPFDVHMMISCKDAPSLENALHRALHKSRINRVNPRKEFFRSDFETILGVVKSHHGEVEYTADADALEYNQSLNMSDADAEYVEAVYDSAEQAAGDGVTEE